MSSDNYEPVPCKTVLEAAVTVNLTNVLVIGTASDGSIYVAASEPDIALDMLLMERAKRYLLDLYDQELASED